MKGAAEKNMELIHAAFKVDFLENGSSSIFKLRIIVTYVGDYRLAKNEKNHMSHFGKGSY